MATKDTLAPEIHYQIDDQWLHSEHAVDDVQKIGTRGDLTESSFLSKLSPLVQQDLPLPHGRNYILEGSSSSDEIRRRTQEIVGRLDKEKRILPSTSQMNEQQHFLPQEEGEVINMSPLPIEEISGGEALSPITSSDSYTSLTFINEEHPSLFTHNQYMSMGSLTYGSLGDDTGGSSNSFPSSPTSMLSEQHAQEVAKVYPIQQLLHKLDTLYLTPGQDGFYYQDRDYYINNVETLGSGGFGTLMWGMDYQTERFFAMKRNKEHSEDKIDRLRAECFILSQLKPHNNVVRFIGAVIDEDNNKRVMKMFMELAESGNLADMLNVDHDIFSSALEALPLDQALYYIEQVLQGVNHLHNNGVLHLDIKSVNILVFEGGRRVKLANFGTAVQVTELLAVGGGIMVFTPYFASPEVVRQEIPKMHADVWSVMCVLVELLTTKWPGCHTQLTTHQEMIWMVGQYNEDYDIEKLIPLSQMDLDPKIEQLFRSVFVANPSKRPSAMALLNHPLIRKAPEYAAEFEYTTSEFELTEVDSLEQTEMLDNLIKAKNTSDLQYLNMYFAGPSGLGKTTTSKRLVRSIYNIESLPRKLRQRCSTLLAECKQVLAFVDKSKGTLTFEVAKNLDEETQLICQYMYEVQSFLDKFVTDTDPPVLPSLSQLQPNQPYQDQHESIDILSQINNDNQLNHQASAPLPNEASSDRNESEINVSKVIYRLRAIVGSREYIQKGLLGKILINIVDIGGQPGFTEMIPFLTTGLGVFFVFFPLNKSLDDPCEVSFERDGANITPYEAIYSNREVLSQMLSSIDHQIALDLPGMPTEILHKLSKIKTVATLIGTFKDKLDAQVKTEILLKKLSTKFAEQKEDLVKVIKSTVVGESDSSARGESIDQPREIKSAVNQILASEEFFKDSEKQLDHEMDNKKEEIRTLSSNFKDLLRHPENQEFFAVDNYKGTDPDLDPLRRHLNDLLNTVFKDAKLPVYPSQPLLGVVLRKEFNIVSMEDCIRIGKALRMKDKDIVFTVWYFTNFLGMLIYRPEIKDKDNWFEKFLICSPQIVFDSISTLIVESILDLHRHGHKSRFSDNERENWRKKGQFSLETILLCLSEQNAKKIEAKKLIPVDKLVLLMEHSHLLAKVTSTEEGEEKIRYFMPAILPCATPAELKKSPATNVDTPSPIKISFSKKLVPMGLFCALISELASRGSCKGRLGLGMPWKLAVDPESNMNVKRNFVSFHVSSAKHMVTLVAHVEFIEVRVSRKKSSTAMYDLCSKVLSTVLYLIKVVNLKINPILAFNCPCDGHQSPHSDKLCRLSHDELSGTCFTCECDSDIELTPHQIVWFQQEAELGKCICLDALPFKEEGLSFNWSKAMPPVEIAEKRLLIDKLTPEHCEGYFACDIVKNEKHLLRLFHCLKAINLGSTPANNYVIKKVQSEPVTSSPELEKLMRGFGLTSSDIEKECSDNHITEISDELTDWEFVAIRLKLTGPQIAAIKEEHSRVELRRFYALSKWKSASLLTGTATYRVLLEALLKCKCNELAIRVCRLLRP